MQSRTQCTYCYENFTADQITDDHVIAGAWYPKNVPETVQRFVVPACLKCNGSFSRTEEDILHRLALCLNPEDPAVKEITESVRRACDPRYGRDERDKAMRARRLKTLIADMVDTTDMPLHGMMPFTIPNHESGSRRAILLPRTFDTIVAKWVKGLHRKSASELVPRNYAVEVQLVEDDFTAENFSWFRSKGRILVPGPGIGITQWIERPNAISYLFYTFELWDVFRVYAVAAPEGRPVRELRITATGDVIIG